MAISSLKEDLARTEPKNHIIKAFLQINAESTLSIEAAHYMLEGIYGDIGDVFMPDHDALLQYCYKVASTVGIMMCPLLGVKHRSTYPFAIDLGIAMQLTNICRDVAEDAGMNRVYLPKKLLEKHGITQSEIVHSLHERMKTQPVLIALLDLSEQYYQSADHGMRHIPLLPRLSIIIACRLYRAIGRKIRKDCATAIKRRTIVGPGEKLFLLVSSITEKGAPSS